MSVKLNLGIIITSQTTGAYLSQRLPPQEIQRKGVATGHDGLADGVVLRYSLGRKKRDDEKKRGKIDDK